MQVDRDLVDDTIKLLSEIYDEGDFYGPVAIQALLDRWREAAQPSPVDPRPPVAAPPPPSN